MPQTVTAAALRRLWRDNAEVALLDAREEGPFAEAHPLFAVSLPLSRLEERILDLIPRRDALVVVYDDGEGLAERAAARIEALGYGNIALLDGGLTAYARLGEVYRDVNVPSKAFGELVESICHTPSLAAPEVQARLDAKADMVVLDSRRFDEYHTMSLPTGISVPGAELALRVRDLAPSPATLVVVNCAGRTRSIIGAQSLVNAGIPNPVAALRNGTIGWTLAGQSLEHGQTRRFPPTAPDNLTTAQTAAAAWAERVGVPVISPSTLQEWIADTSRTLYRLDVRGPEDYQAGHPAGFRSAPGGQLVQATDEWVAVRGARLVLFDDDGVRARMTAAWLVQMGWNAAVVETGRLPLEQSGPSPRQTPPPPKTGDDITAAELAAAPAGVLTIIDLAPSPLYRAGHIPGAHFILSSRFAEDLPKLDGDGPLVLTSPDGLAAAFAATEAARLSGRPVRPLAGGTAAWAARNRLERDTAHWVSPPIDVYKRPYEGTDNAIEAMRGYLEWEYGLVAQLANDGIANFRVVRRQA